MLYFSYLIYYILGKRKKDGLYPREVRAPSRQPRPQGQGCPRDGQGDWPQEAHPRQERETAQRLITSTLMKRALQR